MYVLTHVTPVDPSISYAQRSEDELAFGHNVSKWKNATLAFEPSTIGEWENKFWETVNGVFEHMNQWNPRPIANQSWGYSLVFEKDVAELISLSLLTSNHQSDDVRAWRDKPKTPEAVRQWRENLNAMVQIWRTRQIACGSTPRALLDLSRFEAILKACMLTAQGYRAMVAVTIKTSGVIFTSTELGETVPAFGAETKKYVALPESLGSACSKCGIPMRASGRVGRGYFTPHIYSSNSFATVDPRVSMIEWIDTKDNDMVTATFKDMLVKTNTPWCLVLDPEHLTPDCEVIDFAWSVMGVMDRQHLFTHVSQYHKQEHYIEQIEGFLKLLRRIAVVDVVDARRGDWTALHEALEPLLYYYYDAEAAPRNLIIENSNVQVA
jgi:hypothetical protein